MTEEIMAGGTTDPRAMAGFELDMSGLDLPGVESGTDYVDLVAQQFPTLGMIADNWRTYSSGIEAIRKNGHMMEDERLDRADELHVLADARHGQLVQGLQAQRDERLGEIDESLFGLSGDESRAALISLSEAGEAKLQDTVEIAALTGDRKLLRAARALAHLRGFEDVVKSSVLEHGSPHSRARWVERMAVPSEHNLGVITNSYAPSRANLALLSPDHATRQAAEDETRARDFRRDRNRR